VRFTVDLRMTMNTSLAIFGAFAKSVDVRLAMRNALTVPELLNTTVDLVFLTRAAVKDEGGRPDNASDFADWLQVTGAGAFWRPVSYRAQLGLSLLPSPRVDSRRRRLEEEEQLHAPLHAERRALQPASATASPSYDPNADAHNFNASALWTVALNIMQVVPPDRALYGLDPAAALAARDATVAATTARVKAVMLAGDPPGANFTLLVRDALDYIAGAAGVPPSALTLELDAASFPKAAAAAATPFPVGAVAGGAAAALIATLAGALLLRRRSQRLRRAKVEAEERAKGDEGAAAAAVADKLEGGAAFARAERRGGESAGGDDEDPMSSAAVAAAVALAADAAAAALETLAAEDEAALRSTADAEGVALSTPRRSQASAEAGRTSAELEGLAATAPSTPARGGGTPAPEAAYVRGSRGGSDDVVSAPTAVPARLPPLVPRSPAPLSPEALLPWAAPRAQLSGLGALTRRRVPHHVLPLLPAWLAASEEELAEERADRGEHVGDEEVTG